MYFLALSNNWFFLIQGFSKCLHKLFTIEWFHIELYSKLYLKLYFLEYSSPL